MGKNRSRSILAVATRRPFAPILLHRTVTIFRMWTENKLTKNCGSIKKTAPPSSFDAVVSIKSGYNTVSRTYHCCLCSFVLCRRFPRSRRERRRADNGVADTLLCSCRYHHSPNHRNDLNFQQIVFCQVTLLLRTVSFPTNINTLRFCFKVLVPSYD